MPAGTPAISMFHRRLLLLAVVILIAMGTLVGQLGRLTLAKGDVLRAEAESKLVSWSWLPTSRGRILDRKNRVLAQDRPSFDIAIDYRVITGDWAIVHAGRAAKRAYIGQWLKLAPEERQQIVDLFIPIYQRHLDQMWERLGEITGVEPIRLAQRREEIIRRIDQRSSSIYSTRLRNRLEARLEAGQEITARTEEDIRRQVERPLDIQVSAHVLLPRVPDAAAFELMRLADLKAQVAVPTATGGTELREVPLFPGLRVDHAGAREYPYEAVKVGVDLSTLPGPLAEKRIVELLVDGVAYHILGRVEPGANADRGTTPGHRQRRLQRTQQEPDFARQVLTPADTLALSRRLDRGQYEDDDLAGHGGIEESYEDTLRGLRGLRIAQLETGQVDTIEPSVGRDVHLTIDIMLQARVQAAMSPDLGLAVAQQWHGHENPTVPVGTPLNGAAVVLDVDSGDILAMVSTPTISRAKLAEDAAAIFSDPANQAIHLPWIDRSIARPYPPGSIAKALILAGAVKFGKLNLDSRIDCTGHLFQDRPDQYRCWIYKDPRWNTTHNVVFGGGLTPQQALMVSCNIYFFTLGQRLGPQGINDTYTMFGLRQPWNLGVGAEYTGALGSRRDGSDVSFHDAIQMGIGQGPVAWTPLHAADGYATLARQGLRIKPHLVASHAPPEPEDLGLDPRSIREALDGLDAATNQQRGTGHHVDIRIGPEETIRVPHFSIPGVKVWGKTGTAEAPTIMARAEDPLWSIAIEDPELPQGRRALRRGDHSWFVVLVGQSSDERPRYAIAVMMEYAGSGGKVSGPIVAQIIHALIAEDYLR